MKKLIKQISQIDKKLAQEVAYVLATKVEAKQSVEDMLNDIVQETYKTMVEVVKDAGYRLTISPKDYENFLKKTLQGKLV